MFEFMTDMVIMTQFLFIVMLDCYIALRAICWVVRKTRRRK